MALSLFCGLFLITSIANTVKKNMEETPKIKKNQVIKVYDSQPEKTVKTVDTLKEKKQDSLLIEGKSWRTCNKIQIVY